MFDRLLSTFSLVSRIPVRVKFTFDPSRIDFWLPIVGITPALLNLLVWAGLAMIGNIPEHHPLPVAILLLIIQYLCFNLFHLDGLMDTADAFLGSCTREKRLAILKDSRVGTYGFFAGFAVLTLKLALLASLFPHMRECGVAAAILSFPVVGRFGAAMVPCLTSPATPEGLGRLARDSRMARCIVGAIIGSALWLLLACGLMHMATIIPGIHFTAASSISYSISLIAMIAAPLVLIAPLTALFHARLYRRGIGGYTGDALGATVETGEILTLVLAFLILNI